MMVVGGHSAAHNVEIIDLNDEEGNCEDAADYPVRARSTGIYFDGYPLVCGGSDNATNNCYKYHFQV